MTDDDGTELDHRATGPRDHRTTGPPDLSDPRSCGPVVLMMTMITVHNLHKGKLPGEYVGRPRTLGNKFQIGVDGTRVECIAQYKWWLWEQVRSGRGPVYEKITGLLAVAKDGDLRLLCHCAPLPCHADVIKACLEWMMGEGGSLAGRQPVPPHPGPLPRGEGAPPPAVAESYAPSDNDGYAE